MFDQLKQLKQLRDQAQQLKQELGNESVTVEHQGHKLTINGNQEIIEIVVNEDKKDDTDLNNQLKELINKGVKESQQLMARKVRSMGGLPNIPGL